MESTEIISPPSRSARSRATLDLPVAVGPASRRAGRRGDAETERRGDKLSAYLRVSASPCLSFFTPCLSFFTPCLRVSASPRLSFFIFTRAGHDVASVASREANRPQKWRR